jgi:hypothetical protein
VPDDVDPESVDAAPEPETHHIVERCPHVRVAPVQIRLLAQEIGDNQTASRPSSTK